MTTKTYCPWCGETVGEGGKIGFRDTCGRCGRDLHICHLCRFHDPAAYNECREPQAERVLDKDRANFCEYFTAGGGEENRDGGTEKADPRSRLEALFKK